MKQPTKLWCLLAALSCGCGENADDLRAPVELTGAPVALDEHLLLISGPSRKAFLLDAVARRPAASATELSLPFGALRAERRLLHDEALVLCTGRRDSATERAEPSTLAVIESDGGQRSYELGTTPFDKVVQSDDGRYAVLYRGPDTQGRTLQNVNELVVVDLDKAPTESGAVTSKTPEGLAHAFTEVRISSELPIAGELRRLLVLLSAAEITLFDLNHLDRRGTIVELTDGAGRMPQPNQILFGAGEPALYVRGDNTDDVFVFRLESRSPDHALKNDFRPTINPLGAGSGPRDMALYGEDDNQQLLVVSTELKARLINPRSGKTAIVDLPASADHIRLFTGVSPGDTQERTRALLFGTKSSTLMFMDLESTRDRPERNIETLELSSPVTSIIETDRANMLVLTHAQGVTLLDLEQRTATPIAANAALDGALFDRVTKRLWVATTRQPWVGTLDLESGETGELLLDADVLHLVPFFSAGRLLAVHASSIGQVTFIDTARPTRERARAIEGFLLADILDRGDE